MYCGILNLEASNYHLSLSISSKRNFEICIFTNIKAVFFNLFAVRGTYCKCSHCPWNPMQWSKCFIAIITWNCVSKFRPRQIRSVSAEPLVATHETLGFRRPPDENHYIKVIEVCSKILVLMKFLTILNTFWPPLNPWYWLTEPLRLDRTQFKNHCSRINPIGLHHLGELLDSISDKSIVS